MSLSLFTSLGSIATNTNRKINSIADMNLSSLTPLYNNTTSSLTDITFGPGSSSYFSIDSNRIKCYSDSTTPYAYINFATSIANNALNKTYLIDFELGLNSGGYMFLGTNVNANTGICFAMGRDSNMTIGYFKAPGYGVNPDVAGNSLYLNNISPVTSYVVVSSTASITIIMSIDSTGKQKYAFQSLNAGTFANDTIYTITSPIPIPVIASTNTYFGMQVPGGSTAYYSNIRIYNAALL